MTAADRRMLWRIGSEAACACGATALIFLRWRFELLIGSAL
jgi:hypothetical protein